MNQPQQREDLSHPHEGSSVFLPHRFPGAVPLQGSSSGGKALAPTPASVVPHILRAVTAPSGAAWAGPYGAIEGDTKHPLELHLAGLSLFPPLSLPWLFPSVSSWYHSFPHTPGAQGS